MDGQKGLAKLDEKAWYGRMLIENVLAVDVPMISAVNGPCNIHSEVPLLGRHRARLGGRLLPGPRALPARHGAGRRPARHLAAALVGRNRARYLLLTGKKLSAQEALEWGAVNEVLPKDRLLDRAWELARELAKRPPLTLRYTRMLFTQDLKRAFLDELGHGLARETYAQRQFFPVGRRHGAARSALGPGALVGLTIHRRGLRDGRRRRRRARPAGRRPQAYRRGARARRGERKTAAALLGVSRATLYRRLAQYGIG